MSDQARESLYRLLPAIYRIRDLEHGEQLRALLAVIESEMEAIGGDTGALYDNWFIETCDEWAVPYIGDLLGVRGLYAGDGEGYTLRPYVANTLAYRRRKGTVAVLEQLARDVTGWPAHAAEFFQQLATTQNVNHVRKHSVLAPDLRDANRLELTDGPFNRAAHTAEVRHIDGDGGRYNIMNVGLFLWRLQSYRVPRSMARPAAGLPDGRYTFSPLAIDAPLFNRPVAEADIAHLSGEINVPGRLRRRPLRDETEALRQARIDGLSPAASWFGAEPAIEVYRDGVQIPPENMLVCDLSDWTQPESTKTYSRRDPDGTVSAIPVPIDVAVDPKLGRLAFPAGAGPGTVLVTCAYGFSGDLGGGPYDRSESVAKARTRPVGWQAGVSKELPAERGVIFNDLASALQEWDRQPPGTFGVVAVIDNYTYGGDLDIRVPRGSKLLLVAADWPLAGDVEVPELKTRVTGQLVPVEKRPHLLGNLTVTGVPAGNGMPPGELVLNGLLVEGSLRIAPGDLGLVRLDHCTLVPSCGGIGIGPAAAGSPVRPGLTVALDRSISGPLELSSACVDLEIADSIVDGSVEDNTYAAPVIVAPDTRVAVKAGTIFGGTRVRSLSAENSIFMGNVAVQQRQTGCIRFSHVPDGSLTPKRYRCQPDLALAALAKARKVRYALLLSAEARWEVARRVAPAFASVNYGNPNYAQLSPICAPEIRTGAENGAEMGAFKFLLQPLREANLRAALAEYLRLGLEAGVMFVT